MNQANNLLSAEGAILREQLQEAQLAQKTHAAAFEGSRKIHVAGIGRAISAAYEQLRNAAANTEEHLLLQQAVRRFLRRNISFTAQSIEKPLAEELVVELTQAGYLVNDTVAVDTVRLINTAIERSFRAYLTLRAGSITQETATSWMLDVLCVEIEELLTAPRTAQGVFIHFAYRHFRELFSEEDAKSVVHYDISLYIATHRALLRSDLANVRRDMLRLYQRTIDDLQEYIATNQLIDELFHNETTNKLTRAVSKYGAPFRTFRSLLESGAPVEELLFDKAKFKSAYAAQVKIEQERVARKLNRGVIKSIIFLLITKVIIGLAIEVPYDIFLTGTVAILPLMINIFFPPLYMALLRMSLSLPGPANSVAIQDYMTAVLYQEQREQLKVSPLKRAESSTVLTGLYWLMFLISFGAVVTALSLLHFNLVQGIIFFVFLSTASFLGFRLSRLVREIEMFAARQGFFDAIRDFFYTPFVIIGRWLSDKYARVNIITLMLDMVIELPLKTILRLTRQWTRFLNEKRDEL
ncbi:MAG TPA: hypothetical protein VD907_03115 [Verrucomicrobiae bacterium]|nr:hypothetical protein [Verrucomicrobiae bacterium]